MNRRACSAPHFVEKRVRAKTNFLNAFNVICPGQPLLQNILILRRSKSLHIRSMTALCEVAQCATTVAAPWLTGNNRHTEDASSLAAESLKFEAHSP